MRHLGTPVHLSSLVNCVTDDVSSFLCGTPGHVCSSGDWRQAYANFLVKYVQFYKAAGVSVTHLGFLNEPDYKPGYSQMQISTNAAEAIDFLPILSKAVSSAGLEVNITCCDAVGWGTTTNDYAPALARAGSQKYMSVLTSHSYSGDATKEITVLDLPKWNTEAGPSGAFSTTWYASGAANEGFTWANKLAVAIVNAKLSAYLFWEGLEIKQQQSALHLIDTTDGTTAVPSGIFWAFAMWSRYIRPGAVAVSVTGSYTNVITGAYKNTDGSVIVVMTNSGTAAQSVKTSFSGFTPKAASAWVTATGKTFASTSAGLSGTTTKVSVPAKGVVTLKLT
jgi:O-glycosyl hydrolase